MENMPSGGPVCVKRKDQRDATEFFDGTNIPCAQKISGLGSAPLFPVTGVEVWRDPDDRFHRLADGFRGRGWRIVRICDPQESDGPIALEVIGRNVVGAAETGIPNTLRRPFVSS